VSGGVGATRDGHNNVRILAADLAAAEGMPQQAIDFHENNVVEREGLEDPSQWIQQLADTPGISAPLDPLESPDLPPDSPPGIARREREPTLGPPGRRDRP